MKIIDGKADMSAVLPKYVCEHCGLYYQELLGSGFYDECNDLSKIKASLQAAKPKLVSTGNLQPMQLKKDIKGQSVCPRCGDKRVFNTIFKIKNAKNKHRYTMEIRL